MLETLAVIFIVFISTQARMISHSESELQHCYKFSSKFAETHVCEQRDLAVECMQIETPIVTDSLYDCYKQLNIDPFDLKKGLDDICSSEELIKEASECLCNSLSKGVGDYEADLEDSESKEYNNEENENIDQQPYNSTIVHCLNYMDYISRKLPYIY
ncbi:uncharacterized protein LOC129227760 [Uloborus diversus]|uniref:uncharacterized protein LOC129227760 n=1 Tax=Uloborus diversus TaxID=327109 RepID=UPI002409B38E|nr:uncharacterized protein LOC129227760 [Uloborus diversus]